MPSILTLRLAAVSLWIGLTSLAAAEKPNIILILADDLGYETVGCYGGSSYPTPHLDQLAANGMRFDRAYAMPLCTNTRIQLMTGKYNQRNWVAFGILDPGELTFGHLLQRAGYKTCMAGKWQLTSYDPPDYPGAELRRDIGMRAADAGFHEYSLWHTGHTEHKGSRYANPVIEENGRMLEDTEGKYGPDLWTDFIGDFITRHREEPFFVYYSMALPHNPMNPTPDSPEWQDPTQRNQDLTRFAADMIRYTDKMVGKVVAKVDELGLREKTLILFYSDNGTNTRVTSSFRGRTVRGEKGKGTELGVRVPLLANWLGRIPSGQASQALIDSVDFLPTLLELTQATPNPTPPRADEPEVGSAAIDGSSFLPVLQGKASSTRSYVYIHQDPRPGWDKDRYGLLRLAIDSGYKLYEDGRLFDMRADMFEQQPIWIDQDNESQRQSRQQLQQVLDTYKPYPMFDPRQVPRPDTKPSLAAHSFQDQGGLVVIEAEQLPLPRDEAWTVENYLPAYLGLGYLRSLREQPKRPEIGLAKVAINVQTAGKWSMAVRCRSDHFSGTAENAFWLQYPNATWQRVAIPESGEAGKWIWLTVGKPTAFHLDEGRNEFHLAPLAQNLKMDRLVFFQSDQQTAAKQLSTPASDFSPWGRP